MLRNSTKDELIDRYRKALSFYADPNKWSGNKFLLQKNINYDDCSGLYLRSGEIARQALLFNENASIPERKNDGN